MGLSKGGGEGGGLMMSDPSKAQHTLNDVGTTHNDVGQGYGVINGLMIDTVGSQPTLLLCDGAETNALSSVLLSLLLPRPPLYRA